MWIAPGIAPSWSSSGSRTSSTVYPDAMRSAAASVEIELTVALAAFSRSRNVAIQLKTYQVGRVFRTWYLAARQPGVRHLMFDGATGLGCITRNIMCQTPGLGGFRRSGRV